MKNRVLYMMLVASVLGTTACKKSFTERPALDTATVDNYYTNAEQVRAATGTLYGEAWFPVVDKGLDCIGDLRGGNMFTWDNQYTSFRNFTTTANDPRVSESWSAFYKVAGWANILIQTLETKKAQGISGAFIDAGIAEARFIRGVAYFYIGRIWGAAPIVTDPAGMAQSGNFNIPRYIQKDVLRFALEDLKAAEAGLPETDVKGRATKFSAKGIMAKLYLYSKDYENAKAKALEVINSGKFRLDDYSTMFNSSAKNNNPESVFSLQHVISNWGTQNTMQAYRAPENLLVTGDGWSAVLPSLDIIKAYEAGDMRRRWSLMEHGNMYPQWRPTRAGNTAYNTFMANGYRYDTLQPPPLGHKTSTRANIAKYVVGPGGNGEPVQSMQTQINTYILRYADVLLIYAEAVLGANASTTDAAALKAFNDVRNRAGLASKTSITLDDILKERRVEFAFEGDYWFDISRQGYAKAKQIVEAQNRGWKEANGTETAATVTFSENQLFLPIPISESAQNPKLLEAPVPFY